MGGYNRVYLMNSSTTEDMATVVPSEVYIVLHERQTSVDARYSNYAQPYCQQTNSEIISVHYQYEDAASNASKYVRDFWDMDDEDEEWLEQLDWQGEGWYDEKVQQIMQEMHRVHILAMQIH
mmetsp:Transcript_22631/g.42943  ORF Transcript_22631/g.42943 Transcript_22631/m.42943 type:complete len:122 (-) Transcript_22631:161-526(-)